jgi:hypothetical protein
MIVIGLVLGVFGIGFFCWLLFTLAIYALPSFAALTAGLAAFHGGAGVLGALAVGAAAGIATLIAGQIAFAATRSIIIRFAVALLFAVPAAVAGYHATLGLAEIGVPSQRWREAFAVIGAIIVGGMAWGRMTLFASPLRAVRHPPASSAKPSLAAAVSED